MKTRLATLLMPGLIATSLLLTSGCSTMLKGHAGTIRVQIVDESTGQPVSGVSAMWREDLDDQLFGHLQNGPANLAPSDADGVIVIADVRAKMTGHLVLFCPGYTRIYGVYSEGSLQVSDNIQPPPMPQDLFTLDDEQTAGHADGIFVVRMHK